jgi:hypothetical protein
MVLEVLVAADSIPLSPSNCWVQDRIVKRAGTKVRRWLKLEVQQRKGGLQDPDDLRRLDRVMEQEEARWEVCDLLLSGPRREDLALIQSLARGEKPSEIAKRLGISTEAVWTRIRRARQHLQHLLRDDLINHPSPRNIDKADRNRDLAVHRTVYGQQSDLPKAA